MRLTQKIRKILILLIFSTSLCVYSTPLDWDHHELGEVSQLRGVLGILERQKKIKNPPQDLQLQISFVQGVLRYHEGRYSEAVPLFDETIKGQFVLDDYAYYFLGLSHFRLQQLKEASDAFSKVVYAKHSSPRKLSARYRLGEISLENKDLKLAQQHFQYLEKHARGSEKYPYIIWNLAKINASRKNSSRTCRYVRDLYSKYPTHELLKDWTLDMASVNLDGLKPKCLASLNDQKTRIRNLQYSGASARARQEIQSLYERSDSETKYYVDMIYARFLTDEGDVDEALKTLLPYYAEKSGDSAYLMQLARTTSRKGDDSVAIGAFLKIYNTNPRSSVGREALFQAAFASYLVQDYEGALTRFSDYKKKYGGRYGVASSWYIAWIQYLKGDYQKAYDSFNSFSKMRMSKRLRRQFVDTTRINYWKAVSLVKLGRVQEGAKELEKISKDPSINYYSIAAKSRLLDMKQSGVIREIASLESSQGSKRKGLDLSPLALINPEATKVLDKESSVDEELLEDLKESQGETADSAEEDGIQEDGTGFERDVVLQEESDEVLALGVEEIIATLKDPRLQKGFQRAETLKNLSFLDWSNRELQYIEAKTRNKVYLQTLMEKYESSQAYYRSSYISEIYYEYERKKSFSPSSLAWTKSFPQAFKKFVDGASHEFGVPSPVIWGVMRTESFFRPTIKSSVGALGLMQVMPLTGQRVAEMAQMKDFQVPHLLLPQDNIRIGSKYLQRLSKMFSGSLPLVAAGYNAGPHRVYTWLKSFGHLDLDEFIEHIPYNQTRGYAKKVVRSYYVYSSLYNSETLTKDGLQWLSQPPPISYSGPVPTKETWEAL